MRSGRTLYSWKGFCLTIVSCLGFAWLFTLPRVERSLEGGPADGSKKISIAFRYDDFSQKTNLQNWETSLFNLFVRHGIPLSVGVIPNVAAGDVHDPTVGSFLPLSQQRANLLQPLIDAKLCEIALHGYTHQARLRAGNVTEFVGLPFEEQVNRIQAGKIAMEKIYKSSVQTFIPPWNSFDVDTLRALEQTGFRNISALPSKATLSSSDLRLIPYTAELLDLQSTLLRADRFPGQVCIIVLFHGYDFKETDPQKGRFSLRELDSTLSSLRANTSLGFKTLSQVGDAHKEFNGAYANALADLEYGLAQSFLPRSLRVKLGFLPEPGMLRVLDVKVRNLIVLRILLIYGSAICLGFGCMFACRKLLGAMRLDYRGAGLIGLLFVGCVLFDFSRFGATRLYRVAIPLMLLGPVVAWVMRHASLRDTMVRRLSSGTESSVQPK